ncbi:MAG: hypothetical protein VST70_09370 [Nitrospirota bacterium]|nr:hypothetical protein [Nitrospirota bacterium]
MKSDSRKLDPTLLGKISVARILELSLSRFDLFVRQLESGPEIHRMSEIVTAGNLSGAELSTNSEKDIRNLGEIVLTGGNLELLYHRPGFIREYRFNEDEAGRIVEGGQENSGIRKTIQRLRLVNTRNRLTFSLVRFMIRFQADYLRTGDPMRLRPLTLAQIASALSEGGGYSDVADSSRISRLMRTLRIKGLENRSDPLASLAPSVRQISCYFVSRVIEQEKIMDTNEGWASPLTDTEISERIGAQFGGRISRRTVAHIRREMGIPEAKERAGDGIYHKATLGFSPAMSLSPSVLKESVPDEPGVYEIRSTGSGISVDVIYIGSTGNLRTRLHHHLQGTGNNRRLRERIAEGAWVRFRIVRKCWREEERAIYRSFCATFGAPPECNRMSP